MSESLERGGGTMGWSPANKVAQVRERFVAAWEQAAEGGPPPDLSDYLTAPSEPDSAELRRELESLDQFFRQHLSAAGGSAASRVEATSPATVELPGQRAIGTRGDAAPSPQGGEGNQPGGGDGSMYIEVQSPDDTEVPIHTPQMQQPADGATRTFHPGASDRPGDVQFLASRAPASVPTTVAGYEILGVLGRGGMGVVYKARQPGLKRVVALKMILSGGHAGEDDLGRFRSEAQAVARLQHPNIVQIYEVGEDDGRPYFSLEYVDGGCLSKQLHGQPQPPHLAAEMALVLTKAIAHAHAHGIVHRDLKPANVLLAKDGTPKVTDFGLAKRLEEDEGQTRSGSILGTPDYMSPEQASGQIREIGPRSDIYALGAMLYEFTTGRVPLRGASVLETLQQVVTKEPVAPTLLQPKLPRDLETICLKCLHNDPAKRYATADDLAEDLRRFLASEPILARPIGTVERAWRACRRNPRVAALTSILVVIVAAWAATASALALRLKVEKDATDQALVYATTERRRANENAELAKKTAEEAQRREQIARKSAAQAIESASVAKKQHDDSVNLLLSLGDALQQKLRSRRELLEAPELRALQGDVLDLVRRSMTALAKDIEASNVSEFAMAGTCDKLGELLWKLGHTDDALRQFEHGYELVRPVAAARPDEDLPRANLALLAMKKGRTLLALNNAAAAQACFREACSLRQEIVDHPRDHHYTDAENHEQLSHFHFHLGEAELALGRPAEAHREFLASLADRGAWLAAKPGDVQATSFLSQAYLYVGVVGWHLGEADDCQNNFRKSLGICHDLAQRFPRDFSFRRDLGEVYGEYCEAKLRLGLDQDARTAVQRSLEHLRAAIDHDPDDISMLPLLALTYERMAAVAERLGEQPEAGQNYAEARKVREDLLLVDANNPAWQAAYALTLAHCGEHAAAAERIAELVARFPDSVAVQLQAARCYAVGAAAAPEAERPSYRKRMIEALRSATKGEFHDPVLLRTDPDLASIMSEPAATEILTRLESSK